jgi:hypothetical protein
MLVSLGVRDLDVVATVHVWLSLDSNFVYLSPDFDDDGIVAHSF